MRATLAAIGLALIASLAAAQSPLPQDDVPDADRERFRLCRAAAYHHLDGPPDPAATVPRALAQTLRDQIVFIMFETLRSAPAKDLTEAGRVIAFTETFFLSFASTLSTNRARLTDLAQREALLLECVPFVWQVMRENIDYLMLWREQSAPQPAEPYAAERR